MGNPYEDVVLRVRPPVHMDAFALASIEGSSMARLCRCGSRRHDVSSQVDRPHGSDSYRIYPNRNHAGGFSNATDSVCLARTPTNIQAYRKHGCSRRLLPRFHFLLDDRRDFGELHGRPCRNRIRNSVAAFEPGGESCTERRFPHPSRPWRRDRRLPLA